MSNPGPSSGKQEEPPDYNAPPKERCPSPKKLPTKRPASGLEPSVAKQRPPSPKLMSKHLLSSQAPPHPALSSPQETSPEQYNLPDFMPSQPLTSSLKRQTSPKAFLSSTHPNEPVGFPPIPNRQDCEDTGVSEQLRFLSPETFPDPEFWNKDLINIFQEDESESWEEGKTNMANGNSPVYEGAPITLHESLVSILTLALSFSLSGTCIEAILHLVNMHCLTAGNIFKKSLYLFKKYFSFLKGPVEYEYYCSLCFGKIEKTGCLNCMKKSSVCCLIKLPLENQLQTLFLRKGFVSKLLNFSRKPESGGLCDIYDGNVYKEHVKKNILGDDSKLSLMWYTDGASLFESSKMSVWPLFLFINELPFHERIQKENVLVPALWCGPVKPHGNILTRAVYSDLVKLQSGVVFEVDGGNKLKVKCTLLSGTGDTPARALMLNMVQHNGECSCQRCIQRGESREGLSGVRVFPFRPDEMVPRTAESMERYGDQANKLSAPYLGLKGSSVLSKITLDIVKGTAIDSMHNLFGGVAKAHTKYIVDKSFKSLDCYVTLDKRNVIDKRLLDIKPPHFITRVPRSIDDLAHWKTSMYKSWFLYYSVPVLKGLIPDQYFLHYCTLVAAVMFLNADCVTTDNLQSADLLIQKFLAYYEDLFTRENMPLNVHLLLHLVEMVKDLGPLWVTSCFPQESINGVILNLVHGTRHAAMQISASLQMCLGLPDLVTNLEEGAAKTYCQNLMRTTQDTKVTKVGDCAIIGKWKRYEVLPNGIANIVQESHLPGSNFFSFKSLRKQRILYTSESIAASSSRDSSSVVFNDNGKTEVGIISDLLRITSCHCKVDKCQCESLLYAFIQRLDVVEEFETLLPNISVPNIKKYKRLANFCLIKCTSLLSVCVKIVIGQDLFIAIRSNHKEIE